MASQTKSVSGKRVYVTFLHDGTIALHPSVCSGPRYKMESKGSIHLSKKVTAKELGEAVLRLRAACMPTTSGTVPPPTTKHPAEDFLIATRDARAAQLPTLRAMMYMPSSPRVKSLPTKPPK